MNLKDLELISTNQELYDAFNSFMLSSDLKIFGKLLARTILLNQVKDVPGDIIEFGVFKGTGIFTFLKLKRYFCPNTYKKVIGFDFFNSKELTESLSAHDKKTMTLLFEGRNFFHDDSYKQILENKILESGFLEHEFELIQGDVSKTVVDFVENRPGAKISILYLDLDLENPTFDVLTTLWSRVSSGGIVVFDEYAYHNWSESIGVDRFFEDKNIKINSLNFYSPSAYVIKP
tara:strand:- start:3739 stop:4434 length:696 start_codon:yes stop_codon:yes gene_type:complete